MQTFFPQVLKGHLTEAVCAGSSQRDSMLCKGREQEETKAAARGVSGHFQDIWLSSSLQRREKQENWRSRMFWMWTILLLGFHCPLSWTNSADTKQSHELESPHPSLGCRTWNYCHRICIGNSGPVVGLAGPSTFPTSSEAMISDRDQQNPSSFVTELKWFHRDIQLQAGLQNRTSLSLSPSAEIPRAPTHPHSVGDGVFGKSSFSGFPLLQPRPIQQKALIIWGNPCCNLSNDNTVGGNRF